MLQLSSVFANAGTLCQIRTRFGTMEVELYDEDKPVTVANFKRYVQSGSWTNMFIQRWETGFVIQAGGFYVSDLGTASAIINQVSVFGTITNEYSVGRTFSNTYGTLAMALAASDTNSGTSQWFVNLTNNSFLDASSFTVFGRVVRGTNVLQRFNNTSATNGITVYSGLGGALSELPVTVNPPNYADLIYLDLSLLSVNVATNATGGHVVSWNSVSNKVQRVEFTTNSPPNWQLLSSTNGNGLRLSVTDTNKSTPLLFYRVRVDY